MATPSSGGRSLDQMNVEAGGSSGSAVSINDSLTLKKFEEKWRFTKT